jgi:hypothetical protein
VAKPFLPTLNGIRSAKNIKGQDVAEAFDSVSGVIDDLSKQVADLKTGVSQVAQSVKQVSGAPAPIAPPVAKPVLPPATTISFAAVTTGENNAADMVVGDGASLTFDGGTIDASTINEINLHGPITHAGMIPVSQADGSAIFVDPMEQGVSPEGTNIVTAPVNPILIGGRDSSDLLHGFATLSDGTLKVVVSTQPLQVNAVDVSDPNFNNTVPAAPTSPPLGQQNVTWQTDGSGNISGYVDIPTAVIPVTSVFTRTGAVVATSGDYTVAQVTGAAPLASPTFTGTVSGITASMVGADASGAAATAQSTAETFATAAVATEMTRATTAEALLAPLASPTFTGTVVLPSGQALIAPVLGTPASGTLTNCTGLPYAALTGAPSIPALINSQATNYTAALADAGQVVNFTDASAVTFTVPTNASVAFALGTILTCTQTGAGQITLTPAGGVTINTPSSLTSRTQYSTIGVIQITANVWTAMGDLT